MKKGMIFFATLLLCFSATVSSDQLSKIAVVDFQEIADNFPRSTPAYNKLLLLKSDYDVDLEGYRVELNNRKQELLEAKEEGNDLRIAEFERNVASYEAFIREWQEIKIEEIVIAQNEFLQGTDIALDILKAIEYVAINEGYTLVLDANATTTVIWWSEEIDITDLVIQRLRIMAR